MKEKRNFLGCEIDKEFYNSSTKRLKNKKSQTSLF
jgi:DNA modification methylase